MSPARHTAPRMLVVEDDPLAARAMSRLLGRGWPILHARSRADALTIIEGSTPLAAAVVDLVLEDGDGMDVVARVREKRPNLPVLIVTGSLSESLVNRAAILGATYVCKPDVAGALLAFAARSLIWSHVTDEALRWRLEERARAANLSLRETQIATLFIAGTPRRELGERCGITENTVKTEVRVLLRKWPAGTLEQLASELRQGTPMTASTS